MAVNARVSKDTFFDFDKFEQDYNATPADMATDASTTNSIPGYQAPLAGLESPHYASTEMPVPPYYNPMDYSTTQNGYMAADEFYPMPDMGFSDDLSMFAGGNYSQEQFYDFFNPQPNTSDTATAAAQQQFDDSAVGTLEQSGYATVSDLVAGNTISQGEFQYADAAIQHPYDLNVQATSQLQEFTPSLRDNPPTSSGSSPPTTTTELHPTPDASPSDARKYQPAVEVDEVLQQELLGDGSTYAEFFNLVPEKWIDTASSATINTKEYQPAVEDDEVLQQELLGDGSTYAEFFNLAPEKRVDTASSTTISKNKYQAPVEDVVSYAASVSDRPFNSATEMHAGSTYAVSSNAQGCQATVEDEVPADDSTLDKFYSSAAELQSGSTEVPPLSPPKATAIEEDETWNKYLAATFSAEHFQQVPSYNYSDSSNSIWSSPVANPVSEPLSNEQLSFPEGFGMPPGHQYSAANLTQAFDHTAGYNAAAASPAGQNFVSNNFTNARSGNLCTAPQTQQYYPSSFDQAGQQDQPLGVSTRQGPMQRQQTMRNTHPSLMSSRKRKQAELAATAGGDRTMNAAAPTFAQKRSRTVAAPTQVSGQTKAYGTAVTTPSASHPHPALQTIRVKRNIDEPSMITLLGHAGKNGGFLKLKDGRWARVQMSSAKDVHVTALSVEETTRIKMEKRAQEQRDGVQQFVRPSECFK